MLHLGFSLRSFHGLDDFIVVCTDRRRVGILLGFLLHFRLVCILHRVEHLDSVNVRVAVDQFVMLFAHQDQVVIGDPLRDGVYISRVLWRLSYYGAFIADGG